MDLTRALEPTAGIADPTILRRLGITGRSLQHAVAAGQLVKLRRGRYALPRAHPHVVAAVTAGGRLGCVSALRMYGAWVLADDGLHVRIARGVDEAAGPTMRVHWSDERGWRHPIDSPAVALATAVRCVPLRHAVIVADSVVNKRILRLDEVTRVLASTPRGRKVLRLLDPASESGLETLARLALRGRGIQLRSQVNIPNIGRVDLVIGDRLVLELDGESWHGDFERDRARDRALITLGYLVLRITYRQLLEHWNAIEQQILSLVRRREHLWRQPHAALGHVVRGYRASKSDGNY